MFSSLHLFQWWQCSNKAKYELWISISNSSFQLIQSNLNQTRSRLTRIMKHDHSPNLCKELIHGKELEGNLYKRRHDHELSNWNRGHCSFHYPYQLTCHYHQSVNYTKKLCTVYNLISSACSYFLIQKKQKLPHV